jgi:hypothetical protein
MNTKQQIVAVSLCITLISIGIFTNSFAKTGGAPDGNTGSPGDGQTCAHVGCHTGTGTFKADVITSDVPAEGYLSDASYTITVTISEAGKTKFGFQASPQDLIGNKIGTMTLINATETKLTGLSKYITHTSPGTSGTDSKTWSFKWTPGAVHGTATIYAAVNASNDDGHASGDHIYFSSLALNESPDNTPTAISAIQLNNTVIINNPVVNYLDIQFTQQTGKYSASIFDLSGRKIFENISTQNCSINVTDFANGTYLLYISNGAESMTRKFVKL